MRAFMKKHDIWLRLLSIVLAVILWAIVMESDNPEKTLQIGGVSVTLTGDGDLKGQFNLSVIETDGLEVAVRIRGKNSSVTSVTADRIVAVASLASITQAGEYDLPVQVTSLSRSDVVLESIKPTTVHVRVDEVNEKMIPVKVAVSGTPANGYRAGTATTTTKNITVVGPASELEKVSYALVTVDASGAASAVEQNCTVALCDEAGEPIESKYLEPTTTTINVTLPIYKNGAIPLKVTLQDGETVTSSMAQVAIDPSTVQVYGDQNTIEQMKEINLGTIDLDTVKTGRAITMPIALPKGVSLVEGEPTSANVTITIDGMVNQDHKVTDINLTDMAENPTRKVELVANSVTVQLRGTEDDLKDLTGAVLTVDVKVDSSTLEPGTHVVSGSVTATGLPDGVKLLDNTVDVQIKVTAQETGTPDAPAGSGTTENDGGDTGNAGSGESAGSASSSAAGGETP